MLGPHLVGLQVFGALRNVEHVDKPGGLVVVDGRVRITTLMSQISWIYPRIVGNIKRYTRNKESSPYPRLGRIKTQSRSSLDRSHFLCRYLCRRANFWVSTVQKTLFPYTNDTLNVSKSLDTVSVSKSPTQFFCIGNSLAGKVGILLNLSQIF